MAEINVDFRNIVASKKCAVSSPRIVNLEIGDESPGGSCESAFQCFFLNDQVSLSDVKYNSNLICGYGNQNDKNFLIHSQSPLSTSTCDERPSGKIRSNSDTDFDLLDLLNSSKLEETLECGTENFTSKKIASADKMKITPNFEVSGGLSDLMSTIAHEVSEKDGDNPSNVYCQRKNTQNCEIDLLDFDFTKNKCSDSLPFNNSSLKVEDNLSELLSCINIEDSNVTQVGSFKSRNMCNSKIINKPNTDKEPSVADLSDLLSSIDLQNFNDNKVSNCNPGNLKVVEINNQQCFSDLLSSFDIEKSNKATKQKETHVTNLSDLLLSVDLGDSNDGKVSNCNLSSVKRVETKNESCLNDLLSSVDADKSAPAFLNSNPLGFSSSNLSFNCIKGVSDSLDDFTFDIVSCSSSNNSCSSSYSEQENNSPEFSLNKSNLETNKVFESDSGYNSIDSAPKEFSFFDYSSDNQSSFNMLLTKKSANIATKHEGFEDARNTNEEISMSDLLTIVSPEFKNPILANLNKAEKHESNINDSSSMLDLIESLNIKSKNYNPHVTKNNSVECDEKLLNYDCIDGHISKKIQSDMKRINFQADGSLEKLDTLIGSNDNINDDEQATFIDLRECVKSAKHQFTHTSPIKQVKSVDNQSVECFSPNKILFYCEEKSPSGLSQNRSHSFEFNDAAPRKKSRVNINQTMFSKALACKPKKDQFLLQKVTNIKNELLNSFIYRPIFIDCEVPQPILESVVQSDRCIISNVGRRSFGLDTPCELQ